MNILQKFEQKIYNAQKGVIHEKMGKYFLTLFLEALMLFYLGILNINTRILTSGLSLFVIASILFLRYDK